MWTLLQNPSANIQRGAASSYWQLARRHTIVQSDEASLVYDLDKGSRRKGRGEV